MLTIHREKGRLNNFTVGFCGDLKFGRTVHSLVNALSRYENINFVLISPNELKLPRYVKEEALEKKGLSYIETTDLESVLPDLDIPLHRDEEGVLKLGLHKYLGFISKQERNHSFL